MRWLYLVPALLFAGLAAIFASSLLRSIQTPPGLRAAALLDSPAPRVTLPALDARARGFLPADLAAGHVTVVNVFASWCVPCHAEAPALARLAADRDIALYGIVYKDKAASARGFLDRTGNPFARIDLDTDGRAGMAWGIDGVPETFVVDGKGIVRLRYPGPLVGDALAATILPAIARARHEG